MSALLFDQFLGKVVDWLLEAVRMFPPMRRFFASRKLAAALTRNSYLFAASDMYSYSLVALCQAVGEHESARAFTVRASLWTLTRTPPTWRFQEWGERRAELMRIINEVRQLVRGVGDAPKNLKYVEIYSQLQPRLNEFMKELEPIVEERLTRFPSDLRFLGLA